MTERAIWVYAGAKHGSAIEAELALLVPKIFEIIRVDQLEKDIIQPRQSFEQLPRGTIQRCLHPVEQILGLDELTAVPVDAD
jgi:hypothetical protein